MQRGFSTYCPVAAIHTHPWPARYRWTDSSNVILCEHSGALRLGQDAKDAGPGLSSLPLPGFVLQSHEVTQTSLTAKALKWGNSAGVPSAPLASCCFLIPRGPWAQSSGMPDSRLLGDSGNSYFRPCATMLLAQGWKALGPHRRLWTKKPCGMMIGLSCLGLQEQGYRMGTLAITCSKHITEHAQIGQRNGPPSPPFRLSPEVSQN